MIKKHTISIKNALAGLKWAIRTQPNYRVHFSLSLLALLGSYYWHVSSGEFLLIIFLITIGLVIETVNTAIEETTDAIDKKWRDDIKIAKDVSAAAMLIFALGSVIIASLIFIPKIF
ncbi:MAG: diacylglycerol kinase family protein [Microgenomates group bacterium]|nr:diacylglycerol kinase family protein [Microgenomates group bacterium]